MELLLLWAFTQLEVPFWLHFAFEGLLLLPFFLFFSEIFEAFYSYHFFKGKHTFLKIFSKECKILLKFRLSTRATMFTSSLILRVISPFVRGFNLPFFITWTRWIIFQLTSFPVYDWLLYFARYGTVIFFCGKPLKYQTKTRVSCYARKVCKVHESAYL